MILKSSRTFVYPSFEALLLLCQIIVFVALLVGGGFMLMVGIELALGWAWDQVTGLLGTKKKEDPENPAALVGSFKRYK